MTLARFVQTGIEYLSQVKLIPAGSGSPPLKLKSMNYAKIEVSRHQRTVELSLTGELDLGTAALLVREIEQRLEDGARVFRVDLRNVSFLDSAGVKALLCCLRSVRVRGGRMLLARPSTQVRRIFSALGFECFLLPAA